MELVYVGDNLIDLVWDGKPAHPKNPIFLHPVKYAGKDFVEKIADVRTAIDQSQCDALIVSATDEIAWLFNLRGSDVEFNPVFIAYASVTKDATTLYVDPEKVPDDVATYLKNGNVTLKKYSDIYSDLRNFKENNLKVWLDPAKSNASIYNELISKQVLEKSSPVAHAKSLKNSTEISGMKESHRRDAAALISFFSWLEDALKEGRKLDEFSVSEKLAEFRSKQSDFVSLSFDTIAGSGPNGAIIHYRPEKETAAPVVADQLFLCDSGGQYRDGTTDVTRTIHFGTPSQHQRECFTRVLQGVINLNSIVFPKGTSGRELDLLARQSLWKAGLDYRHGTGHGVGAFLNVHEGPQGIHFRDTPVKVPLEPGMTVTNEPGYYEDGNFGIRIENVEYVVEKQTQFNFGDVKFYGFDTMTMVPIQQKMIEVSMLNKSELDWIDRYHQRVFSEISPLLEGRALQYLKRESAPIDRSSS
eukprot:TRINITY_DN4099_c0_g1_i4.p1 TRINITY_DN4099_c0_g1~~TRINITY_DN4099_c0_g1_i4.p1  ORF type:complete len:472 (-),score=189.74 TRINITY_DN4099_c0_g1_i4:49-1464(-)